MSDERYGIWITTQHWATVDGGPDDVGTREEMEALAAEYTRDLYPGQNIAYEARPYTNDDPVDPEDRRYAKRLEFEKALNDWRDLGEAQQLLAWGRLYDAADGTQAERAALKLLEAAARR